MNKIFKEKGVRYGRLRDIGASKSWFTGLGFRRRNEIIISKIRAGHMTTNEYLHRINRIDSAACPCGPRVQDLNHLFWACPLTQDPTEKLVKYLISPKGITLLYEVTSLVFAKETDVLKAICNFVGEIVEFQTL